MIRIVDFVMKSYVRKRRITVKADRRTFFPSTKPVLSMTFCSDVTFFLVKKSNQKRQESPILGHRTRPWPARRTFIPSRGLTKCFVQIQVQRMTDRFNRILVLSNTTPQRVEYE
jgi:hypothetical protein